MTEAPVREVVVARLRPHVRVLFWPTVLLLAVCAAYGYFGGRYVDGWPAIAIAAAAGVLVLVGWVYPLLAWLARNYTITTSRTVVRSGVFVRLRREVLHSRVRSVTMRSTWLQSLFRSGDLEADLGGDQEVVLRDVPGAVLVQEVLHDLIEASRAD